MRKRFDSLLKRITRVLRQHYGDRLVSVVVYGSVGRGTPGSDSDIDLLVIAEPLPRGRMARVREFDSVERALEQRIRSLEKLGIFTPLSPVFKPPAEVEGGSPLFLDMIDDGRILYDPSGFWKRYMADFQARLRRLGARRIYKGERWYWELKPDYKTGEIFEI